MRLRCIACEVFARELCHVIATSPHEVDVTFLPKGLHDRGGSWMAGTIQEEIDRVEPGTYRAICLAYGLCNRGIVDLGCAHAPLVVPRGHDCITCFLGDRERYRREFEAEPGTYWLTSGWIERGGGAGDPGQLAMGSPTVPDFAELVAKYGEDNACYLYETFSGSERYGRYAFVEMGVEEDDRFEREARRRAARRGWRFAHLAGDLRLLRGLIDGPWDADFLVVEPGARIAESFDERVVEAARCPG